MTVELEEFAQWRDSVEVRLGRLETASDAHAMKIGDHGGLITAMDKDVSDAQAAFRAQLGVLNAVRKTQSEQTTILREHTNELKVLNGKITQTQVGIQTIIGLLTQAGDDEESGGESQGGSPGGPPGR